MKKSYELTYFMSVHSTLLPNKERPQQSAVSGRLWSRMAFRLNAKVPEFCLKSPKNVRLKSLFLPKLNEKVPMLA